MVRSQARFVAVVGAAVHDCVRLRRGGWAGAQRRTRQWLECGAVVTNVVTKAGRAGARWGEGALICQWLMHKFLNLLAELFESRPLRHLFVNFPNDLRA